MKQKLLLVALLLSLPLFLTACTLQDLPVIGPLFKGKEPAPGSQTINLTMWGVWENPEVMDTLIAKYKTQHPNVNITYDNRSIQKPLDYRENVFSKFKEGQAPADIVRVHSTWVPFVKDHADVAPATFMDAAQFAERFYPSAVSTGVIDGKVYAIPLFYDGLVLVYNKDHFSEINQEEPPTAWEEFRKLALELTIRDEKGAPVRAGAAIGTANNIDFASDILGLMLSQAAQRIPDDLDSTGSSDALKFYTNFSKEDRVWDSSFPEASAAFAQEKVSMIFVPSWNLLDILQARPDLDIGVAAVPQALPQTPVAWSSFWMEIVPKYSANKQAAWEFLNFLAQEEQQLLRYSESLKYRQFGSPYSLKSLAGQITEGSYVKPVLDQAPYAKTGVIVARSGNDKFTDIIKAAVNSALSPEGSTKDAAGDALKKAKAEMYK